MPFKHLRLVGPGMYDSFGGFAADPSVTAAGVGETVDGSLWT